jgi:hypothetical protein
MASACTLLCPTLDPAAAFDAIETHRKSTTVRGSLAKWTSDRFKSPEGDVIFLMVLKKEE